jgi:hypothetical protein
MAPDKRIGCATKGGAELRSNATGGARRAAVHVWRAAAVEGLAAAVAGGRGAYDRRRCLPRLIALGSRDLDGADPALDREILVRLKRALRGERARGRAGHWTYDLDRHLALLQAIASEETRRGPAAAPPQAAVEPGAS